MARKTNHTGRIWLGSAAIILLSACSANVLASSAAESQTATLRTGVMRTTVTALGSVRAQSVVKLSFAQAGTLVRVDANEGDFVNKGDVIAQLNTRDLRLVLLEAQTTITQATIAQANAEANVVVVQAAFSRTLEGARPAELAAAQSVLNAAVANYNKTKQGPDSEDTAAAQAQLNTAEAALRQAQWAYDQANARNPASISASPEALALEQATNNYHAAKANFDRVAKGADTAQLAAASQQVQSARATLDKVKTPARKYDIDQAVAQLAQAKLQVDHANAQLQLANIRLQQVQGQLDQATLRAPFAGVVVAISARVGESVQLQPVVTLMDVSNYHVDVTVEEVDVAKLQLGQEVVIALDSLPGTELRGKIERISPESTLVNGLVSYPVRLLVTKTDATVRSGMTAHATIVLGERDNVLLAPSWAVRLDKTSGKAYLRVKTSTENSETQTVEVKTGATSEAGIEIVSGAQPGQVVVAP